VPPGWTRIAGPDGAPRDAEVYIATPDDPLPLAFCVPHVTPRVKLIARSHDFDPRAEAFVEDDEHFTIAEPFTTSDVVRLDAGESRPESNRFRVTLDGDALFLHCAQHFPGWQVTVDGEPQALLRVNSIFRGVRLDAGEHLVEFAYRPRSLLIGLLVALAGALSFIAGALVVRRAGRRAAY